MAAPSVEQEYRAFIPRLLRLYPAVRSVAVRDSHRAVAHVAHGWYMRCCRGAQAVLTLEDAGFQVEAAPIRRSVLEHVVALKWLAGQGGTAADTLRRGAAADAQKRKKSVQDAGWTSVDQQLFDAVIQGGEGLDAKHDYLLAFKHRCDEFGTPHDWTTYLIETAQSHPCWESAVPYLDLDDGTPAALSVPETVVDQAPFCAVHLFEGLCCLNAIFDSGVLDAALNEIGPQFKALVLRQRDELGLPVPPSLRSDS